MSKFETLFHYHLSTYYPMGASASVCLFYPQKYHWQQLCHIVPQSKANGKLCKRAYGIADMIDLPLVNVIPGARAANFEEYTTKIATLPPAVMCAARSAIFDYARKRPEILEVSIVKEFLESVPLLADLIKLQEQFQMNLREALCRI